MKMGASEPIFTTVSYYAFLSRTSGWFIDLTGASGNPRAPIER